jgi:hypothetical protein
VESGGGSGLSEGGEWLQMESRHHPGKHYWYNTRTHETSWKKIAPKAAVAPNNTTPTATPTATVTAASTLVQRVHVRFPCNYPHAAPLVWMRVSKSKRPPSKTGQAMLRSIRQRKGGQTESKVLELTPEDLLDSGAGWPKGGVDAGAHDLLEGLRRWLINFYN